MTSLLLMVLALLQVPAATRPGVVAGQLRLREGAPAVRMRVSAVPAPPPSIRPSDGQNYFATTTPAATVLTDAQGRYRLGNLAPGRYFVLASALGYPTFYPSVAEADRAVAVVVDTSPVEDVDFTVLLPPGGEVSGRVTSSASGGAAERAILSGVALGELVETPVANDGSFSFGHVPRGKYLVSLFPTPPGMESTVLEVQESDVRLELVRPGLRTLSGRVVVERGPLPFMLLGIATERSYVDAHIAADGTFTARVHEARHDVQLGGLPPGYRVSSIQLDGRDATRGIAVGGGDVSGVVVTLAAPQYLQRLRGRVGGVPPARLAGARVELTGRIIGTAEAAVRPDGSFEFPALAPGSYRLRVPQAPDLAPVAVVVGWSDAELVIGEAR